MLTMSDVTFERRWVFGQEWCEAIADLWKVFRNLVNTMEAS